MDGSYNQCAYTLRAANCTDTRPLAGQVIPLPRLGL